LKNQAEDKYARMHTKRHTVRVLTTKKNEKKARRRKKRKKVKILLALLVQTRAVH